MGRPPGITHGQSQTMPVAIDMGGLVLPKLGGHSLQLTIGGTELKRLPLLVQGIPPTPNFGQTREPGI